MSIFGANKLVKVFNKIIKKEEFRYLESGKGQPPIILHGLMGG